MTLAEMVIVMAIISLVASMLIPSFYMATRKTRKAICLNNLRILQSVADQYSLSENVSDQTMVTQDILINTDYLIERMRCPEGDVAYQAFIIKDGPVCPRVDAFPDHKLED